MPSHQASPNSSSDDFEDERDVETLEPALDDNKDQQLPGLYRSEIPSAVPRTSNTVQWFDQRRSFSRNSRDSSETPSLMQDKGPSLSPSTEELIVFTDYNNAELCANRSTKHPLQGSTSLRSDWSHLPQDLQFYLAYFCQNVNHHHYSLTFDSCDFIHTTFLDMTLRNEALLNAVVGFSAFQRTLHFSGGKIQVFLRYYNKAVSLLLQSFRRGRRHNLGTLLAILQLATIEEHLGDWVNLLGHQKAAHEILTELYTPETVMESSLTRTVLGWYARFDVFAGLMGGFGTVLSREWFSHAQEYYQGQIIKEPDKLDWKIEEAIARHRLIAMDMSILFAKKGKGEISLEQFIDENESVSRRVLDWKEKLDPALQDPHYLVTDFTGAPPIDPDDIINPYLPNTLYRGPLWSMNFCMIDWYSLGIMHRYQTALTLQSQPSKELGATSYAICQLFEAIEYWPHSPKGSILACQASLGIAALFLPRDEMHHMWCRRKLAAIESEGYIYSRKLREKMSALFQDSSCMHWWLPDDEKFPTIIRQIRTFVEERTSTARDIPTEDLRDMKAIFASLDLNDDHTVPLDQTLKCPGKASATNEHDSVVSGTVTENMPPLNSGTGDVYGLGFDEGHGFWGGGQGGGAYGMQRPGDYF
ncbi:MAG: hypothetical protein M1818_000863 [Claussenomyces sp. TS43310]|nr:MAG: hypothetical protein M1818_000863 [Claussenomyces sp. TS43310]